MWEPDGRGPTAGTHLEVNFFLFFFFFLKKTAKTSLTFVSGFPQGIFDSDWKRLLPIEQLLGKLFKMRLPSLFPSFPVHLQCTNSHPLPTMH